MKRTASVVALVCILTLSLAFVGCTKKEVVNSASDVIDGLKQARPLVQSLVDAGKLDAVKAQKTFDRLDSADHLAINLRAAFERDDQAGAIKILQDIIAAVDQLAREDATLFADTTNRLEFLAALGLANIALHFLANRVHAKISTTTPAQKVAAAALIARDPELETAIEAIERFNDAPEWGRTYAR
jgi:hypothetical protein